MKKQSKKPIHQVSKEPNPSEKLGYSLSEVSQLLSVSRTSIYREILSGRLIAGKIGSRTIVTKDSLDSYVATLTPYPI